MWSGVTRASSQYIISLHGGFRNLCSRPASSVSRSDNTQGCSERKKHCWLTVCGHVCFLFLHDHFGGEISLITDAANVKDAIGQSVPNSEPSQVPSLFLNPPKRQKLFCFEERALLFFRCRRTPPALIPPETNPNSPRALRVEVEADLPLHLVGLVTLAQAEGGCQVAGEVLHLLNVGQQSLVDRLLVRRSGGGNLLLL